MHSGSWFPINTDAAFRFLLSVIMHLWFLFMMMHSGSSVLLLVHKHITHIILAIQCACLFFCTQFERLEELGYHTFAFGTYGDSVELVHGS